MGKFGKRVCSLLVLVSMVISMFPEMSFNASAITEVTTNKNPGNENNLPVAEMSDSAKKYASYQDGSSTATVLYTDLQEAAKAYDFVNYFSGEPIEAIRTITRAYPFTPRFSETTDMYCFKNGTYRGEITHNNKSTDINSPLLYSIPEGMFDSKTKKNPDTIDSGVNSATVVQGYFLKPGESFSCLYTNVGQYPVDGVDTDLAVLMQATLGDIHICKKYVDNSVLNNFSDGKNNVGFLGPYIPAIGKTPLIGVECYYADTYNVTLTFIRQSDAQSFINSLNTGTATLSDLAKKPVQVRGYALFDDIDGMQGVELLSGFDTLSFNKNANDAGDGYHFINYVSPDRSKNENSLGYFYATDAQGYNNDSDITDGLRDQITLGMYHGAIATYNASQVEYRASMFKVNGKGYKKAGDVDYRLEIVPDNQYNLPFYSWNEIVYNPSAGVYKKVNSIPLTKSDGITTYHTSSSETYDIAYYTNTGSGLVAIGAFPLTSEPEISKKVSHAVPGASTDENGNVTMPDADELFDSLSLGETSEETLYYYVDAELPVCAGNDTYTAFSIMDTLDSRLQLKSLKDVHIYNYNYNKTDAKWKWTLVDNDWNISLDEVGVTVQAKPKDLSKLVYDSTYRLVIPCKIIVDPGAVVVDPTTGTEGENTEGGNTEVKTAAPAAEAETVETKEAVTAETTETIANAEPATVVTAETAEPAKKAAAPAAEEATAAVEDEDAVVEAAADTRSAGEKAATTATYTVKFIDKKNSGNSSVTKTITKGTPLSDQTNAEKPLAWKDTDGCSLLGWQAYCPEDHTWLYMRSWITITSDNKEKEDRKAFWAKAGQELSDAYLYVIDNGQNFTLSTNYLNNGEFSTVSMDGKTIELYAVWGAKETKTTSKTTTVSPRTFEPNGGGKIISAGSYNLDPQYSVYKKTVTSSNTTEKVTNNESFTASRSGYTFLGWRVLARKNIDSNGNYLASYLAADNNRWLCTNKNKGFYEYSGTAKAIQIDNNGNTLGKNRIDAYKNLYYAIYQDNMSVGFVTDYMQEFYAAWAKAETTNFPSFVESGTNLSTIPSTCTISTAGVNGVITDAIFKLKEINGETETELKTITKSVAGNVSEYTVDLNSIFAGQTIDGGNKGKNVTLEVSVNTYYGSTKKETTILEHTFYVGEEKAAQSDFSPDPTPIEKFVTDTVQTAAGGSENGSTGEADSSATFMVILNCGEENYAVCGDSPELETPDYNQDQIMRFVMRFALQKDAAGNLYYTIQSMKTGKYLTLLSNGAIAWADSVEGNAGQQWHLEEVNPAVQDQYYLRNGTLSNSSNYLTGKDPDGNEIINNYSLAATSAGEEKKAVTLRGIDRTMNKACLEFGNEGDNKPHKISTGDVPVRMELEDYILYDYSSDISFTPKDAIHNVLQSKTSSSGEKGVPGTTETGVDLPTTEVYWNKKAGTSADTSIDIELRPYINGENATDGLCISKDSVPATYSYDLEYSSDSSYIDLSYDAHLIPANNVHYEEDFLTYTPGDWTSIGEDTTLIQDGSPKDHGYDKAYSKLTTAWSGGTTLYTNVSAGENNHSAEWIFNGTGFDIISQTSKDSGTMFIAVYKLENGEWSRKGTIICDTYLNDEGNNYTQIPVVHKTGYEYGTYRVVISACYNKLFDHRLSQTKSAITEDRLRKMFDIPEGEELTYIRCSDSMNAEDDQTAQSGSKKTAENTAENMEGSYNVYIDAVRVYNPLGFTNTENGPLNPESSNFSPEAYQLYKENGALDAEFIQLRKSVVLSANDTAGDDNPNKNSALFVACDNEYGLGTTEISGAVYLSTSGNTVDYVLGAKMTVGDTDYYPVLTNDGKKFCYDGASITTATGDEPDNPLYLYYIPVLDEEGNSVLDEEGNPKLSPRFSYKSSDNKFHSISGYGNYLFVDNTLEARGPENEIYLPKGSAIAFKINDFSAGQQVLISMKAIRHENSAQSATVTIDGDQDFDVCSNTEVYYNITDCVSTEGEISIYGKEGTTSICNIQVTGRTPTTSETKTATITAKGMEHYAYQALMDAQLEEHREAGHEWDEGVVTKATCTEPGYVTYTCTVCGDTSKETKDEALGHSWSEGVVTKATCTEPGYVTYTCTVCGETSKETKDEALGHSWSEGVVTAATCTEPGYTTYTCSVCGETYTDAKVSALGHEWDEGVVTQKPTQTEEGVKIYTCLRCGETVTSSIPALGVEEECQGGEGCVSGQFTDTPAPGNWAHAGIDFALEQGLFCGVGKYSFAPNETMTRAMLVTVLWRYEGKPTGYENSFTDVKANQWYTDAIAWAAATAIVDGVGNNRFLPDEGITREQLATILYRYAGYKKIDVAASADLSEFTDSRSVSTWSETAMKWAVADGLIRGSSYNGKLYLEPQGNATRAQAATLLMRFIKSHVE